MLIEKNVTYVDFKLEFRYRTSNIVGKGELNCLDCLLLFPLSFQKMYAVEGHHKSSVSDKKLRYVEYPRT